MKNASYCVQGVQDRHTRAFVFLSQGRKVKEILEEPEMDERLLMVAAAKQNLTEAMEDLKINYCADVNEVSGPVTHDEPYPDPPLVAAASAGNAKAIRWLIENGADVEAHTLCPEGKAYTALWAAAEKGFVHVVKLLINAGADVNTYKRTTGNTALWLACCNNHIPVISILLQNGADPNKVGTANGRTPIQPFQPIDIAVARCNIPVVAQLINGGSNITGQALYTLSRMKTNKVTADQLCKKLLDSDLKVLEEILNVNVVLKNNAGYTKARLLEHNGEYHEALRLLGKIKPRCAQLRFDTERLIESIYGCKGSDGRTSIWSAIYATNNEKTTPVLQLNAWVRYENMIYLYGGRRTDDISAPPLDEMWTLDLYTMQWRLLSTTGQLPGCKTGHTMFAFKQNNQLGIYLYGGQGDVSDPINRRLYRMNADTLEWTIVKFKGSTPSGRYEHAGVLYKGNYYVSGGNNGEITDEFWCLNMSTLKWKQLKNGPTERYEHGMWAANDKLYVLGGRKKAKDATHFLYADHSIEEFVCYDLIRKKWERMPIIGDRPYDISEFTVLPIYRGQEEPSCVIVWGGYTELEKSKGIPSMAELARRYGADASAFHIPYRKRLLRFNLNTETWTLLPPTTNILPKAYCFAAELETSNGQTRIMIGGGYGHGVDPDKSVPKEADKALFNLLGVQNWADYSLKPSESQNLYQVIIADERQICSISDNENGATWGWDLFDLSGEQRPSVMLKMRNPFDSSLCLVIDFCIEDFLQPRIGSVRVDPADSTLLGARVKLRGLKSRADLNGGDGSCMSVKATNLLVAPPIPVDVDVLKLNNILSSGKPSRFPFVMMAWAGKHRASGKRSRSPWEDILQPLSTTNFGFFSDTYRGPVSAQGQGILMSLSTSMKASKTMISILLGAPPKGAPVNSDPERRNGMERDHKIISKFYTNLKQRDSVRVGNFESILREKKHSAALNGSWLKLEIEIDSLHPPVKRELVVSPNISMQNLYHQVLCPALGWKNNYHCYAFRRIHNRFVDPETASEISLTDVENYRDECWIGPSISMALDQVFQPFYIGGAMANDKKILLGDLLYDSNEMGETYLQFIHDFGDWWSHTIKVTIYDGTVPEETSVAHLLSGCGGCPPEDIGGLNGYIEAITALIGKEVKKGELAVDPSNERWWKLLNESIRSKPNVSFANPLCFDIENCREKLQEAIRKPVQKSGKEIQNFRRHDTLSGLASETIHSGNKERQGQKKNNECAVCGVTVALKLCGKCKSVAFCCREHQVQFWPKHKKECKRLQAS